MTMCASAFNAEDLFCPDTPVMKPLSFRGYPLVQD